MLASPAGCPRCRCTFKLGYQTPKGLPAAPLSAGKIPPPVPRTDVCAPLGLAKRSTRCQGPRHGCELE